MKPQPLYHQWDVDDLLKTIFVVLDEQRFHPLTLRRFKKRLSRAAKEGRLRIDDWAESWRYRICAGSLIRRQYHWTGWEYRSEWARNMAMAPFAYPRWNGEPCRLLVLAEQGLGDEILWASCYGDLLSECPDAVIEADPRLIPAFERSFDAHFVNRFKDEARTLPKASDYPMFHAEHEIEAFIPSGNVPKLYRRSREDFKGRNGAYLCANEDRTADMCEWLHSKGEPPFIGISWSGRQGEIEPYRLIRKYRAVAGTFVNLQYFGLEAPFEVHEPEIDLTNDIESTLALIDCLDKVLTVPNTVAHLAGAMGVDTDVIKPPPIYAGDLDDPKLHNRVQWQFPAGVSDWYGSVTTYRSVAEWESS